MLGLFNADFTIESHLLLGLDLVFSSFCVKYSSFSVIFLDNNSYFPICLLMLFYKYNNRGKQSQFSSGPNQGCLHPFLLPLSLT